MARLRLALTTTVLLLTMNAQATAQSVRSPADVFGFEIGADSQLVRWDRIVDYLATVARASDRVLIDTAGRSQRDTARVHELAEFFEQVRPHEVHLVLSGTCGAGVLMEAVQRFGRVGIDRVIFTKLDEAVGFGVLISCLEKADASLSYVTTGQDVPEDIRLGERKALARL